MEKTYKPTTAANEGVSLVVIDATEISRIVKEALQDISEEVLGLSEPTPYLTAEQAATYLGCDRQRIYDLRSQGRLECRKEGTRLLTKYEWLDAVLEDGF
ncbi:MAG: helix-turn-helix domain-containing protein [Solirubrobacterales bacterium]|nr:helix-turn-helix domain-containing protein [Solirubrobacterales bacterium]OJU94171.1 MAG: hypothetical protein BGO23_00405 [Solirubrobacterales bacterium 67-14]